ncbi:uncharacterized protein LOC143531509 [Bidens hawaiensis]|uniref:uncharacterized protein LOC143531509 n=1 Tax=Bidens hawaiensis TaxID=980011 RepID=UPI0040498A93
MSTNIPLDIQVEIIKRLLPAKSLIRFRSVSKQWKSLIDSSEFITDHSVNQAQPHRLLIKYAIDSQYDRYHYVSIVDDDSFPQPKAPIYSPTLIRIMITGSLRILSHGLVCSYGLYSVGKDRMMLMVLWNPSIRKSVGIELPTDDSIVVGFGVCPQTSDIKIVNITPDNWQVEVFTLSSRAWRSVSWNLPYKTLTFYYPQAVVDGVIHWIAYDWSKKYRRIISFDLTREEFGEVELIDSFASRWKYPGIYKLNDLLLDAANKQKLIVLWNPSIRKSLSIVFPSESTGVVGFGVCPKSSDPKIVKITRDNSQAEVFTLSSRTWKSVSRNLKCKSLAFSVQQVVIDGVVYWPAYDWTANKNRIISFDLTHEEFGEVDLSDSLKGPISASFLHIYKFNESLVVLDYREDDADKRVRDVWMMLKNGVPKSSFKKLFTFTAQASYRAPPYRIQGFRKSGQPVVEALHKRVKELEVLEPCSEHTSGLGISGSDFMMASYAESLLLFDHSDSIIHTLVVDEEPEDQQTFGTTVKDDITNAVIGICLHVILGKPHLTTMNVLGC